MTMGGMVAAVPTFVPTITLDRGRAMIIRIRNGTLRSRLMMPLRMAMSHLGRG